MKKPTLERSEASYPSLRTGVRLPCTFYRHSRSSGNRISSGAVQIHACGDNRSSRELTLIGLDARGKPHLEFLAVRACSRTIRERRMSAIGSA